MDQHDDYDQGTSPGWPEPLDEVTRHIADSGELLDELTREVEALISSGRIESDALLDLSEGLFDLDLRLREACSAAGECREDDLQGDPLNPLGGLDSIAFDVRGLIAGVGPVVDLALARDRAAAEDLREALGGLVDSAYMIGRVVSSNRALF